MIKAWILASALPLCRWLHNSSNNNTYELTAKRDNLFRMIRATCEPATYPKRTLAQITATQLRQQCTCEPSECTRIGQL